MRWREIKKKPGRFSAKNTRRFEKKQPIKVASLPVSAVECKVGINGLGKDCRQVYFFPLEILIPFHAIARAIKCKQFQVLLLSRRMAIFMPRSRLRLFYENIFLRSFLFFEICKITDSLPFERVQKSTEHPHVAFISFPFPPSLLEPEQWADRQAGQGNVIMEI